MFKLYFLMASYLAFPSNVSSVIKNSGASVEVILEKTKWIVRSEDSALFDYLLEKSRDCDLVMTYGGSVIYGNEQHKLLGTEYSCKDSEYIRLESGGPYIYSQISFKRKG